MDASKFIRTDTADDAVSSLELAADFCHLAQGDDRYWKWFVVALHAGVQGIFVLALEGGNSYLVQKPGVMVAMLAADEAGSRPPQPYMDNFLKLYKKLQQSGNLRTVAALPLQSSPMLDHAVASLDTLRDDFLHFNAKSWSIERAYIIESAAGCVEAANFVVSQSQSILWHDSEHAGRATSAITQLRAQLGQNTN